MLCSCCKQSVVCVWVPLLLLGIVVHKQAQLAYLPTSGPRTGARPKPNNGKERPPLKHGQQLWSNGGLGRPHTGMRQDNVTVKTRCLRHDGKKGARLKRMRLWKPPHTGLPWVMMLTSAFVSFVSCLDACLDAVGVRPPTLHCAKYSSGGKSSRCPCA
jgi:hypothetical protein